MNTKLQAIKSTAAFILMLMNENITYLRALKKTEITEINIKRYHHQTQTIGSKNIYLLLNMQIRFLMI